MAHSHDNTKERTFSHLTSYDRGRISALRSEGKTLQAIADVIGCHKSTIGQKLKKARLYHAHTLSDAAKYLGVNERSIRNWEKDTRNPLPDNLKKLEK